VVVYAAAGAVVGVAAVSVVGEPLPNLAVWAALTVAYTAALAFPIRLYPGRGGRVSMAVTASVTMGFMLPLGWAVLATAVGAVASGLHIRRFLTTPGGMLWGSSWVTLSCTTGYVAQQSVLGGRATDSVGWTLAATGAYAAVNHVTSFSLLRFAMGSRGQAPWRRPTAVWVVGLFLGAAAALMASISLLAVALLAVPYAAIIGGGSRWAITSVAKDRLHEVLEIVESVRRETSPEMMESALVAKVSALLGAQVRLGVTPEPGDISAPFPSPEQLTASS
jgi:hypothetical protein